jgi:hypothetical protein
MVKCRGTLIAEVAALGLAIAFTSTVSVVTVIILLSMRLWLIGNSRTIVPVMLMVIGAILIARGTYSLTT